MGSGAVLAFRESKDFFELLDTNIKRGNTVTIRFKGEKPEQDSKLWKRLRYTKDWGMIKNEFGKIQKKQPSPMSSIASSNMVSSLTGGEILLIAWIATLIAGITAYAIYKGRRVRIKVSGNKGGQGGDGEIIIE